MHNVMDRGLWERVTRPDGALAAAKRAQAEGLVDHIGISIHRSPYVMREAIHTPQRLKEVVELFAGIQIRRETVEK